MQLLANHFNSRYLILCDDINSRRGDALYLFTAWDKPCENPDQFVNSNEKNLIKVINDNRDLVNINEYIAYKIFDSYYTFYRGTFKSQVDFVLANNIENISLDILNKYINSDHCAISVSCRIKMNIDLKFINECINYDNRGVNMR